MSKKILLWVVIGIIAIGAIILASLYCMRFETVPTVDFSSLKFKEIKDDFDLVLEAIPYKGTVAFTFDKDTRTNTKARRNYIGIYNVETGKMDTMKITDEFLDHSFINIDDNWILHIMPDSQPYECIAINSETNKIEYLVPKDFLGNYVIVRETGLLKDDAFVVMTVYEKRGTFKDSTVMSVSLGDRVIKINLKTKSMETIFDGIAEKKGVFSFEEIKDGVAFLTWSQAGQEGKGRSFYVYKNGVLTRINSHFIQNAEYFKGCKDDDTIIYSIDNLKEVYAHISNLDRNATAFKNLRQIDCCSKDYFVAVEVGTTMDRVTNKPVGSYSKIHILNRKTNKRSIIELNCIVSDISIYGDELCFVKLSEEAGIFRDSIIYLNLKENSF